MTHVTQQDIGDGFTNYCIRCRIVFSATRPICCDKATDCGGFHKEGICKECCDHPYIRYTDADAIKEAWQETWELEGVHIG